MKQMKMKKILMLIAWLMVVSFNQRPVCASEKAIEEAVRAQEEQERLEKERQEREIREAQWAKEEQRQKSEERIKQKNVGIKEKVAAVRKAREENAAKLAKEKEQAANERVARDAQEAAAVAQGAGEPEMVGLSLEELFGNFISATDQGPEDYAGDYVPQNPKSPMRLYLMKRIDGFIYKLLHISMDTQGYEASIKHLNEEYQALKRITARKITSLDLLERIMSDPNRGRLTSKEKLILDNTRLLLSENKLFAQTLDELMRSTYEQLNLSPYSQESEQIKMKITAAIDEGRKILGQTFQAAGAGLQQAANAAGTLIAQFPVLREEAVYQITDAVEKARRTFASAKQQAGGLWDYMSKWWRGNPEYAQVKYTEKLEDDPVDVAEEIRKELEGKPVVVPTAAELRQAAPLSPRLRAEVKAALNTPPGGEGVVVDLSNEENARLAQARREAEERLQQQEADRQAAEEAAKRAEAQKAEIESARAAALQLQQVKEEQVKEEQVREEQVREGERRHEEQDQIRNARIRQNLIDLLQPLISPRLNALIWHAMQRANTPLTISARKDLFDILAPQSRWAPYLAAGSVGAGALIGLYKYTPEEYRKAAAIQTAAIATGAIAAKSYLQKKYERNQRYKTFLDSLKGKTVEKIFDVITTGPLFGKLAHAWNRLEQINYLTGILFLTTSFSGNNNNWVRRSWRKVLKNIDYYEKAFMCVLQHVNEPGVGERPPYSMIASKDLTERCGLPSSYNRGPSFTETEYFTNYRGDVFSWLVSKSEDSNADIQRFFNFLDGRATTSSPVQSQPSEAAPFGEPSEAAAAEKIPKLMPSGLERPFVEFE